MIDYTTFSDFEIECRVSAEKWKERCISKNNWIPAAKRTYKFIQSGECVYRDARYCSNWADAGPIIEQYRIHLNCSSLTMNGYIWQAGGSFKLQHRDKNPRRAAMICFLMMKESKND